MINIYLKNLKDALNNACTVSNSCDLQFIIIHVFGYNSAFRQEKWSTLKNPCFHLPSPPSLHYYSSFPTLIASSTHPKRLSSVWLLCVIAGSLLSVCLLWLGLLLCLTAAALTSMTFFSCLMRHQTPALGEATLSHRCKAAAKLCTGTQNRKRGRTTQNNAYRIWESATLKSTWPKD